MAEPKVVLHPGPGGASASAPASQQVQAAAAAEVLVEDARKRIITLKRPGILAQYRMVEILGESAGNQTYLGMVMPLIFVAAIDSDPVRMPNNKREVDALIERLGEEGVAAVMVGLQDHFGGSRDLEADKNAIKK
jgi:hypothetical protein